MVLLPFQFSVKTLIEENRTTQSTIDTIKQWIQTSSLPQLQEEFIALFLLSCSHDVTTATKTIEAYFRVKNKAPEIFNGWNLRSKDMENILQVIGCCIVPARMENNTAVCCVKINDDNYRNFDIIGAIKYCCMVLHLCQISDPPNELIVVFDLKGMGFMHLTCLKIGAIVTYLEYIQEAVPLKIKNFHVLNSNFVLDKILSLFKMFIKRDLMESIKMYSPGMDMKEFQEKWVPASCLPKEYDGSLPEFDKMAARTVEELRKMQPFFENEELLRCSYEV